MIRVLLLVSFLAAALPCSLTGQAESIEDRRAQLWLSGTGGVGTAGMAGSAAGVVSVSDWAVSVRYAKAMSGGGSREVYTEDLGLLIGRVMRREGRQGSVSVGAGRVSKWDENYVSCSDCWFGASRSIGGTRTDNVGVLLDAAFYPGANGGVFVWGVELFGAISPARSYMSVGVTLGLGRTP